MVERKDVIRLAVFGMPVKHSRSPAIHRQFARQCDISIDYAAIETAAGNLGRNAAALADAGGAGCNVTLPLKHEAWELARERSPAAEHAQAANTLVFRGRQDWLADNTDGRGLLCDLDRCLASGQRRPLAGSRILIAGAGGAVAGILGDLLHREPAMIVISNRNPERAARLAKRFGSLGDVSSCAADQVAEQGDFDLVINATSLGHTGSVPGLPDSLFSGGGCCYDLNYGVAAKPLREHCAARGIPYQDGLGMLVEQAAISFCLWTGRTPKTGPVLQQLRLELLQC
jgi:shikimate dehydrogenase